MRRMDVKPLNKDFEWRTGRYCVFKIFLHLVFITKYRRDVLTAQMIDTLNDIFRETCAQMDGELIEFGAEADHVHLMVSCPPKMALASFVGKLKGKSSYVLRRQYALQLKRKLWGSHLWSPSYCAVSCGGAPLDVVKQYVADQQKPPSEKAIAQFERVNKRHSLTRR
jgi:putative transposase